MNEKLEALRRRIEHEDNLVNQRLSWLVASQAFMLTAFAISLNAPPNSLAPAYYAANRLIVSLLPYAAIACVVIIWITLAGAIWSMKLLRAKAASITLPNDIPVQSPPIIRGLGLVAPIGIPAIFLVLWVVVIIVMHRHAPPCLLTLILSDSFAGNTPHSAFFRTHAWLMVT